MKKILMLFICMQALSGWAFQFEKSQPDSLQQTFNKDYVLRVKKAQNPIQIDGVVDEPDWIKAEKATNFYRVLPVDTGMAESQSEVVMTYDDKAFYLAFTFFDTIPGKRIAESFRRDFVFGNNDNFLVFSILFWIKPMGSHLEPLRRVPSGTALCMMVVRST